LVTAVVSPPIAYNLVLRKDDDELSGYDDHFGLSLAEEDEPLVEDGLDKNQWWVFCTKTQTIR